MGLRFVAPTLAPLPDGALARGWRAALVPGADGDALTAALGPVFGDAGIVVYDSGRAALAEALRVAMRATGRRRVVLPAYTSYSVAAAAAAAGTPPVLCDVDPATLAFDRGALRGCVDERTAAVVLGNLFGWPEPTADLEWLHALGVLLVDDAAQALGAREGGEPAGRRGQLGVLSFGRGKCVTLGGGGALLVGEAALRPLVTDPAPGGRGLKECLRALAVRLSRHDFVLAALARLPGVRLGESFYEPEFTARAAPASVRAMADGLIGAVEAAAAQRTALAGQWQGALSPLRVVQCPRVAPGIAPAFLRYPVLAPSLAHRERLVGTLGRVGFGYVRSFPAPLGRIAAFAPLLAEPAATPGAEALAARVIALPCHARVGTADVARAVKAMESEGH